MKIIFKSTVDAIKCCYNHRHIILFLWKITDFERLQALIADYKTAFPQLEINVDQTIEQFKWLAEYFRPMTIDTITYLNNFPQ